VKVAEVNYRFSCHRLSAAFFYAVLRRACGSAILAALACKQTNPLLMTVEQK
jgi:hypothetical protein